MKGAKNINKLNVPLILKRAVLSSAVIVVAPMAFYFFRFGGQAISSDSADWGQFSDFINVFVGFATLLLTGTITLAVHSYEVARDEESKQEEAARERPVLIFKTDGLFWTVMNIGNGPAINIRLSFTAKKDEWEPPVHFYSLMKGEEKVIEWVSEPEQFKAVYNDLFENTMTSTMENDTMDIRSDFNGLDSFQRDQFVRLEDAKQRFRNHWHNEYKPAHKRG